MDTILILVIAAGLSAAVVWWASVPPGTPLVPRRRPRSTDTGFQPSFRETFQTTGPEPSPARAAGPQDSFMLLPEGVPDDRPPRFLSLLRLIFTIAFVAALGVATLALLGLLVKLQLDKFLSS
jgi:hypothetical protein